MNERQIREIYRKYGLPENLQEHMMRVAGVIRGITDRWAGNEKIDKEAAILAGYFHDLGNPIKFRWDKPELLIGMSINEGQRLQAKMIAKYGNNVIGATLAMAKEAGLSDEVVSIIKHSEWSEVLGYLTNNEWESVILVYCDMRIGPLGILSVEERINDLATRSKMKLTKDEYIKMARIIETEIEKRSNVS